LFSPNSLDRECNVGNVNEAMRKYLAEQAERAAKDADAPGAAAPAAGAPAPAAPAAHVSAAYAASAAEAAASSTAPARAAALHAARYARDLAVHHDRGGPIAQQYRALRDNLLAATGSRRLSVMVASAHRGEGKTVTCLNLALVLAEDRDRRTLVVDANLRRSRVAAMLRAPEGPGVAEVLTGSVSTREAIQRTAYPNLFVLPAGQARVPDAAALLRRPVLDDLLAELAPECDYMLVDTSAVSAGPDAGFIGRCVPRALVVARLGRTPGPRIANAIGLLRAAGITPVGMALVRGR
jgi:Mrp family chromosome partitioning ATPase